jgi:hypothetical protein
VLVVRIASYHCIILNETTISDDAAVWGLNRSIEWNQTLPYDCVEMMNHQTHQANNDDREMLSVILCSFPSPLVFLFNVLTGGHRVEDAWRGTHR